MDSPQERNRKNDQTWPDGDEYVTMDFFRFDQDGRIVKHWDSIQSIPETSANGNRMY